MCVCSVHVCVYSVHVRVSVLLSYLTHSALLSVIGCLCLLSVRGPASDSISPWLYHPSLPLSLSLSLFSLTYDSFLN